jgi:hypothetical protein
MSTIVRKNGFRAIAEVMARKLFNEFDWMNDPDLCELYFITQHDLKDANTEKILAQDCEWDQAKIDELKTMRRQYLFAAKKDFLPEENV